MPKKPRSPCRFSGCPELTEDMYCNKHRKLESGYYNKYKRDPDTYKQYENRWRKIRKLYIEEHRLCELCERENILRSVE